MGYNCSVVLIGPMGAGKTTVGKILAGKLGVACIDLDQEIINATGMSPADIFNIYGEEYFRQCEHQALISFGSKLATMRKLMLGRVQGDRYMQYVLSTGGGVVLQPRNHRLIKQLGIVVYLSTPLHVQIARVGNGSDRPLLTNLKMDNMAKKISELFAVREPSYLQLADLIVETELLTAEQVAGRVAEQILLSFEIKL